MLIRAYLILYRRRLIRAAVSSLLAVILTVTFLVLYFRGSPSGVEAAFHTRLLVMLFSNSVGGLLAVTMGLKISGRVPGRPNEAHFLLTRPISRVAIQFYPLAISIAAIALLPMLSWVAVLGCLRTAHAQSFTDLAAAFAVGPQPTFLRLIYALQPGRCYLAALAVGLAVYAPLAAQRWCLLSRWNSIRIVGAFAFVTMIFLPMVLTPFILQGSAFIAWVMLLPVKQDGFIYLPSNTGIALHFLFAAVWVCGTFFVLRETEV